MSGMFEDEEADDSRAPRPQRPGRSRALIITAGVLLVLFIVLTAFASFWTERLWFDSVGFERVFSKLVVTKLLLFLGFGALMAAAIGANIAIAFRYRPMFRPASPEQVSLDRYREAVTPIRRWLVLGVSLMIGAFAGASASGKWRDYLLWRNGVPFDKKDPYFHKDIGFYVFDLPWLHYVVDFVMAIAILSIIAAALVHYLYGGIRLQSQHDRFSGAAAAQLSVLLGVFVLSKAADYWLDRFDLLNDPGSLITGITYTDDNAVLPAKNILMFIALICAVLFFANVVRRTWLLPSVGLGLLVLSAILLGMVWPGIVQQFQVEPTQADKEAPYIEKNIDATRAAYDLEDTVVTPYSGAPTLSDQRLAVAAINNPGIRLVDPRLVQQTFEQKQQVRGYYSVAPVLDVDRYDIAGKDRDLVLGVRELDQSGLPDDSKNWANLHTVYTHGYGVVAAYGNQKPADEVNQVTGDEPAWAETDIPPEGELTDLKKGGYEGRIYFGEKSPEYSIVGKTSESSPDIELDLPGGTEDVAGDQTNTYDGKAGVEVGNLVNKLLYAVKFGEPNLVLSGRVHENSRILYDRDPAHMVEKVAPWLTVDGDPFPAVVDGHVVWMLDGYTTTDRYPLSERDSFEDMTTDALGNTSQFQALPTDEINYIRNAVKATVDAYDGTVTLYEWDEEDPMLKAWMNAFPGTVEPKAEIPQSLLGHMRYPEDLFKTQRYQLAAYHVTDADDFYKGNDRWEVPEDPNKAGTQQPPYRLSVETPSGGDDSTFSLTSVYVPTNRSNLAAFVAVDADAADTEGYGTLRVLRLGSTSQIPGPNQIANQIGADEAVKNNLLPFTQQNNSQVLSGNLLTLPVGGGLLYVQPLYTQRTTGEGNYPVLRFVAVSFGNKVGIGKTLEEAINTLLGIKAGTNTIPDEPDPGTEKPPTGTSSEQVLALLRKAELEFQKAEQALEDRDLAAYAEATSRAEDYVKRAIAASNAAPPKQQ